jgi:hypothetical protein
VASAIKEQHYFFIKTHLAIIQTGKPLTWGFRFNELVIGRYQHLKQLFLLTKRKVNYPINHLYYTADQGRDITSFQIG